MSTPQQGGAYLRDKDGSLKLVEQTAQLGTEQHGAAPGAPADEAPPARGPKREPRKD